MFALCLHVVCVLFIGFRSDDEITKHDQVSYERSRHLKGKQYKAVPAEEPTTTEYKPLDIYRASNCSQLPNASVQQPNFQLSNNSTKMNSLNADNVQKLTQSFSGTLTNSRYQPTSPSQYSVSSTSQSAAYQKQSSSQSFLQSHPAGSCQLSQQNSGSTIRHSPSSMSGSPGEALSPDLAGESRSHDPESTERITSGEPLSPRDHPRHRRRRYPSYEYHDDSEDDYYDEEDGNMTAYIHGREHGGIFSLFWCRSDRHVLAVYLTVSQLSVSLSLSLCLSQLIRLYNTQPASQVFLTQPQHTLTCHLSALALTFRVKH